MYGTKVRNFIGLWSTSLELLKFIGSYPQILKSKSNWISISGVPPSCCRCCSNSPLDRVNQSIDSSHRDVIPFIDGGHTSGAMLLFARKSWQTRATCGRALSCCRIRLRCCTSGTATGRKISSLYLTAVILPATIINCDFIPWAMPPQTITEPPPNRSRSTTQASAKRSPRRRYTRRRPSAR